MKLESKDMKSMDCSPCNPSDMPKYPYGLQINLDSETLEKLGMKKLPAVGEDLMITAKVSVCSTHESERGNGENYKSLGLQITDMSLSAPKKSAEEKLYGKG